MGTKPRINPVNDFTHAKVGDRIWSFLGGYAEIVDLKQDFFLTENGDFIYYDGKSNPSDEAPIAYWSKPELQFDLRNTEVYTTVQATKYGLFNEYGIPTSDRLFHNKGAANAYVAACSRDSVVVPLTYEKVVKVPLKQVMEAVK